MIENRKNPSRRKVIKAMGVSAAGAALVTQHWYAACFATCGLPLVQRSARTAAAVTSPFCPPKLIRR